MEMKTINNELILSGKVITEPTFHHESHAKKFYTFTIETARISGIKDKLNVLINEDFLNACKVDNLVTVRGNLRTYNQYENNRTKLLLFAFALFVDEITEEELRDLASCNKITLIGFVCKKPTYRETLSKKNISDILLAVHRKYNQSDYIPCIAWGSQAKTAADMDVGTKIEIIGLFQSRDYIKKVDDGEVTKTAYEVSALEIKKIL